MDLGEESHRRSGSLCLLARPARLVVYLVLSGSIDIYCEFHLIAMIIYRVFSRYISPDKWKSEILSLFLATCPLVCYLYNLCHTVSKYITISNLILQQPFFCIFLSISQSFCVVVTFSTLQQLLSTNTADKNEGQHYKNQAQVLAPPPHAGLGKLRSFNSANVTQLNQMHLIILLIQIHSKLVSDCVTQIQYQHCKYKN